MFIECHWLSSSVTRSSKARHRKHNSGTIRAAKFTSTPPSLTFGTPATTTKCIDRSYLRNLHGHQQKYASRRVPDGPVNYRRWRAHLSLKPSRRSCATSTKQQRKLENTSTPTVKPSREERDDRERSPNDVDVMVMGKAQRRKRPERPENFSTKLTCLCVQSGR